MGIILRFPSHAVASRLGRACKSAKASSVTSPTPRSRAKSTKARQCSAGIEPRARQELTVDGVSCRAPATTPVPPNASMSSPTDPNIPTNIVRGLRTCQEFAHCEQTSPVEYAEIRIMQTQRDHDGRDLAILRKALGFDDQVSFCKALDIAKSTWNPFETGSRPISLEVAKKIKKRFGISLDFTLDRDWGALSPKLLRVMRKIAA